MKVGHSTENYNWKGISKLEAMMQEIEQDLDETIDSKIEEALDNLFNDDEEFESKFHDSVNWLFESEYFTYKLR